MKRILYVWLPCRKIYPLGLVYLANYVHTRLSDVEQKILDISLYPSQVRQSVLAETVKAFAPDVIAFSWRDVQIFGPYEGEEAFKDAMKFYHVSNILTRIITFPKLIRYAAMFKRYLRESLFLIRQTYQMRRGTKILVGGPGFSIFSEEIIQELPEGIIGVVGEGEDAIVKLLQGQELLDERIIIRNGKKIFQGEKTKPVDVSDMKMDVSYIASIFSQYHAYQDESLGIQTKRGCPHQCQFCLYGFIEGRSVRCRTPQYIVDEIVQYSSLWGTRRFWFSDSQFLPTKNFIPVCIETLERLMSMGLDINWTGYVRTDLITKRLADLMVRTGVYDVEISITSGSQNLLDDLRTGIDLEAVYQGSRYLLEAGYRGNIILNYALNVPGETRETLLATLTSYKKFCGIFGEDRVYPFIFFLGIQPHTPLAEKLTAEGYFSSKPNYLNLNIKTARKMLYNPPPLDRMLTDVCLSAWQSGKGDDVPAWSGRRNMGKEIMNNLDKCLALE